MASTRSRRTAAAVAALSAVAVVVMVVLFRGDDPQPVPIVEAELGPDNLIVAFVDRCGSDPMLTQAIIAGERIVAEVTAGDGTDDDCQDRVEVAIVTDDILELEDATSGDVFVLRVVRAERPNRPPGTRE